jgi:uncharacterized membrane protein
MAEAYNSRLETFCDGVFAIALTLLVLDFKTPPAESIQTSSDLWQALARLLPSLAAFLLSFAIIFISWVNHHAFMKAIDKPATPRFIYANGYLLLSVVLLPFPTSLISQFGFTAAASPAVVIYSVVNWSQNVGWLLVTGTALRPEPLATHPGARAAIEDAQKQGRIAFFLYLVCTLAAFRFPKSVALVFALMWTGWGIYGVTLKHEVRPVGKARQPRGSQSGASGD